jgi:hypothetical protein
LQVNPGENGNSPDGGDWDVVGYISKTGDSGDIGAASWSEYKVRLSSLSGRIHAVTGIWRCQGSRQNQ